MASVDQALRALGQMIRAARGDSALTQDELGRRAGIVGKYVSEIERGTRDVPFSTLRGIIEDGLDLRLDIKFSGKDVPRAAAVPPAIAQLAHDISALPPRHRTDVIAIIRAAIRLADR